MIDGDRRIVRAQGAVLHETPINACQQHGRPGKQLLTIPLRECCRGSANGDDEIRLTPRKHRPDMIHHRVIGGAAADSDWLERHFDEVDGLGRCATQLWKKLLRERDMPRQRRCRGRCCSCIRTNVSSLPKPMPTSGGTITSTIVIVPSIAPSSRAVSPPRQRAIDCTSNSAGARQFVFPVAR